MSHDERPGDATEPGFRLSPPETPTDRLPGTASLDLDVEGRTHPGKVRDHNEDTFSVEPPTSARARAQGTLLIVSDGMGGHAAGEVASAIAVETIPAAYYRDQPRAAAGSDSPPPVAEALVGAVLEANAAIYAEAERTPERQGMGCTVVAAVVQASELIVAHVGDSRAYLVHSGQIRQLTRDHSWVGQQVAAGILTPEQAERHPRRSLLLQALGRESQVEVEVGEHPLESGDVLVICSDGLTSVVRDAEIAERVNRLAPRVATERLIALANERGAPDNVTVVVAAIGDVVTSPLPATTQEEITHRRIVADADAEGDTVRLSRSLSAAAGARPADPAPAEAPRRPTRRGRLTPVSEQGSGRPRRPWLRWIVVTASVLALIVLPFVIRPGLYEELTSLAAPTTTPVTPRSAAPPSGANTVTAPASLPPPIPTGLPSLAAAASPGAQATVAEPGCNGRRDGPSGHGGRHRTPGSNGNSRSCPNPAPGADSRTDGPATSDRRPVDHDHHPEPARDPDPAASDPDPEARVTRPVPARRRAEQVPSLPSSTPSPRR